MTQWFRLDGHRQRAVGTARLPVGTDEDWILAALHRDDTGAAAWSRVRRTFDVLGLPDGHERLVPLLYETVARTSPGDPLLPELGRGRLLRLTDRRRLLDAVVPVIGALVDEGIEVMVLKGAALADVYESPAHRPMVDVDLLVPPRSLPQVVDILTRNGLRADEDVLQPVKVACRHSAAFVPIDGAIGTIDLHWMASPQLAPAGVARAQWRRPWYLELSDDEFWTRARAIEFEGVAVMAPSMTDLLLLSVLHGTRFGIADDTRWAVDAVTILRRRGGEVDWDLFVEQATRRHVGTVTAAALDYLSERILPVATSESIPAGVVDRLRSSPATVRERVVDRLSAWENSMRPGHPRLAVDIGVRHLAFTATEPLGLTVRSFPWFVALWVGVERPRQLPALRGRLRSRLRRAVGPSAGRTGGTVVTDQPSS
ncbi:MAG: nucleotidyltransferase family protein [Acidimicrobiia bacterium]|nr:nucleotidyltransferase family protein [Acidimicrobiia bacterium]